MSMVQTGLWELQASAQVSHVEPLSSYIYQLMLAQTWNKGEARARGASDELIRLFLIIIIVVLTVFIYLSTLTFIFHVLFVAGVAILWIML